MIIDEQLAIHIAHEAVFAPFRQIEVMRTDRFAKWLGERGIALGWHEWQTIHHLWQIGVIHPVAVRDITDFGKPIPLFDSIPRDRLVLIDEGWGGNVYADLGVTVAKNAPLRPPLKIESSLRDALLWHPFQLLAFKRIDESLRSRSYWSLLLCDPAKHRATSDALAERNLEEVRESGNDSDHLSFTKLVGLMLSVEPLVHMWLYQRVRLEHAGQNLQDYLGWRNAEVGFHRLAEFGLGLAEVKGWHQRLAFLAKISDPLEHFRILMQHADRDRRDRLKDDALLASDLYDHAEILRRYLSIYHWLDLPDESDVLNPWQNARVHRERFGQARTSDYERSMYRRITRYFGVDPGYRIYCFLEGATEIGFVRRWASNNGLDLEYAGIRLIDLHGKDNAEAFRDELERLQEDEMFVVICIDQEESAAFERVPKHIRRYRRFEEAGLLPIDLEVWTPNFVQHNFTVNEIVEVVNADLSKRGIDFVLEIGSVTRCMTQDDDGTPRAKHKSIEAAIQSIARAKGLPLLQKGEDWGSQLADWASDHPPPTEIATNDNERPIERLCAMLLRAKSSDYALTLRLNQEQRSTK